MTMTNSNTRQQRGQVITQLQDFISRIDEHTYKVKSQSGNDKEYEVISSELGWQCSCPDFVYCHVKCKHVFAVEFSLELRKKGRDYKD